MHVFLCRHFNVNQYLKLRKSVLLNCQSTNNIAMDSERYYNEEPVHCVSLHPGLTNLSIFVYKHRRLIENDPLRQSPPVIATADQ